MIAIAPTDIDVTCSVPGCADAPGSPVTVEVRGKFRLITPLLSVIFGGQDLDLGSSAVAQIEYLPDPEHGHPAARTRRGLHREPDDDRVGGTVNFDASASTGNPTDFMWDFDEDGIVDSTDPNPSHVFDTAGTYTVSLTVINLAGVDNETKTDYIVGRPRRRRRPPRSDPTRRRRGADPACAYPPNVIGQAPTTADANLGNAGFNNVDIFGDLTTGQKNKIQAQNPDHTQCVALNTLFTLHYRPN